MKKKESKIAAYGYDDRQQPGSRCGDDHSSSGSDEDGRLTIALLSQLRGIIRDCELRILRMTEENKVFLKRLRGAEKILLQYGANNGESIVDDFDAVSEIIGEVEFGALRVHDQSVRVSLNGPFRIDGVVSISDADGNIWHKSVPAAHLVIDIGFLLKGLYFIHYSDTFGASTFIPFEKGK